MIHCKYENCLYKKLTLTVNQNCCYGHMIGHLVVKPTPALAVRNASSYQRQIRQDISVKISSNYRRFTGSAPSELSYCLPLLVSASAFRAVHPSRSRGKAVPGCRGGPTGGPFADEQAWCLKVRLPTVGPPVHRSFSLIFRFYFTDAIKKICFGICKKPDFRFQFIERLYVTIVGTELITIQCFIQLTLKEK